MSGFLLLMLALYIVSAGVITLGVVRPALINWYHSRTYWIGGTGRADLLFKLIGSKVSFEIFVLVVSCIVGALGGWVYAMRKNGIRI